MDAPERVLAPMNALPTDAQERVFARLSIGHLIHLSAVCCPLRAAILHSTCTWTSLYERVWPSNSVPVLLEPASYDSAMARFQRRYTAKIDQLTLACEYSGAFLAPE